LIRTINTLPYASHAVGLDASSTETLLLSLSTIAGTKISNPPWAIFQSAGGRFKSAPTEIESRLLFISPRMSNGARVIKAIFFDYDGVLTTDKTGSLTTNRYLSEASGLEFELVREAFASFNADLLIGKTTHTAIWDAVCDSIGRKLDISLLEQAFLSTPANDAMFALARKLRKRYVVGIITDNKKDRLDCLRKSQQLDELFSPIIVSAEHKIGKQGPALFELALCELRIKPEEAIFVDNTPANLVAAKGLGLHTYLHDDEVNDVEGLAAILSNQYDVQFD